MSVARPPRVAMECTKRGAAEGGGVPARRQSERSFGRNTQRAQEFVDEVDRKLSLENPALIAERIRELVSAHDVWRREEAISLNAAENVASLSTLALLNSDLATRVTEGFPGDKDFPAPHQNRFIDEIEASAIAMLRRLFAAKHVEWRPVSTSMANATVMFALTNPGDVILTQPEHAGGNYSYNPNGPPRAARLTVLPLPCLEQSFEVDEEKAVEAILRHRPRLVVIGGSNVLFPYPVRALRAACDAVGATLVYDAAHVGLYLASGMFQDPLRDGAHVVTFSTHKIMSGPVGGVILTNDDTIAQQILPYSFPTLLQTRDQNKYAALAHGLAEMIQFGKAYAAQTVANARSLARALEANGFQVLCADREYTHTHQLFVTVSPDDAEGFEERCQRANLLVTREIRMGSSEFPVIRLTTQEITRKGMTETDMPTIANWLTRIIREREPPDPIAAEVKSFLVRFKSLKFSFDDLSA